MSNKKPAELSQPDVGALDDPAALVAPELSAILVFSFLVVHAVREDEVDASLLKPIAQRIRVVGSVGNHAYRLLSRPSFETVDFYFGERGFRKRNLCRRGTFQPNSQRKTATDDQYHPLRSLAALGFTDGGAPIFARANRPSRNVSSYFNRPSPSSASSSARHASSHTPCSSQRFSRRQQVAGEGYWSGKNLHAAPVCNTHRMPSRQARLETHGRPRLSLRRFGPGSS